MENDAKTLAARSWFGYGRWDAPYWFVGMEPGGTDEHATYETWKELGGLELIDCREHHLKSNNTKWHGADRPPMQQTWGRLIQLVLGYQGKPTDLDAAKVYQRSEWGSLNGDTASLVLSALHAPNVKTNVNRTLYRNERIATLKQRLNKYSPKFVVFYGSKYAREYESIADVRFSPNGYAWHGSTLCILVRHPRWPRPRGWWAAKGSEIRAAVEQGSLPTVAQAPRIIQAATDYHPSDVIRVLIHENPKRGKSRLRFDCYRDGMTVAAYEQSVRELLGEFDARKCRPDLNWDSAPARRFIRIERG